MIAGSTSFRTSLARRKYLDTYFRWKYFLEITWEVYTTVLYILGRTSAQGTPGLLSDVGP